MNKYIDIMQSKCEFNGTQKCLCDNSECEWCLARSFDSNIEKAQFWSKVKNALKPRQVTRSSSSKFWFDCSCGHPFEARLDNITLYNQWCPYCSNSKVCGDRNCEICYDKSFFSHPLAENWSDQNKLQPWQVTKHSRSKYKINCVICKHIYETRLCDIHSDGNSCPYCAKPSSKLCSDNTCVFCFQNSFASHPKAKFWGKNQVNPREVFKSSNKSYIFDCRCCKHSFSMRLDSITSQGNWCRYCSKTSPILCDKDDCDHCYNRSFLSNPLSKFWSNKNEKTPKQVFKGSSTKCIFNCEFGHEFSVCLYNVSLYNAWCPLCKNKTENLLLEWLKNYYDVKRQEKFDWCKMNKHLPFDFVIPTKMLIIELDGDQHFKQVSKWKPPKEQTERDVYKMQLALERGYTVIRVLQTDVWNNKNNWKQKLKDSIEKKYDTPTVIYLTNTNKYAEHKTLMKQKLE